MSPSHLTVVDCQCITKKIHSLPGNEQEHMPVMNGLYVIPNTEMIVMLLDVAYIALF